MSRSRSRQGSADENIKIKFCLVSHNVNLLLILFKVNCVCLTEEVKGLCCNVTVNVSNSPDPAFRTVDIN